MVDRIVARRLIDLEHLAETLVTTAHLAAAAEELDVDEDTLWTRLTERNDGEKTYLQARIDLTEEKTWPT